MVSEKLLWGLIMVTQKVLVMQRKTIVQLRGIATRTCMRAYLRNSKK